MRAVERFWKRAYLAVVVVVSRSGYVIAYRLWVASNSSMHQSQFPLHVLAPLYVGALRREDSFKFV